MERGVCFICGGQLTSKFRKDRLPIFVDRLVGIYTVHMHKICAKGFDKQEKEAHVTCRETEQHPPWETSDDR